ncbi:hypothetical protein B0H13DRAFT_1861351 [Mycena leptocephala]|nr:hypothetical protein B0H13DRAFT_1861351 [Mycena leptocephala]
MADCGDLEGPDIARCTCVSGADTRRHDATARFHASIASGEILSVYTQTATLVPEKPWHIADEQTQCSYCLGLLVWGSYVYNTKGYGSWTYPIFSTRSGRHDPWGMYQNHAVGEGWSAGMIGKSQAVFSDEMLSNSWGPIAEEIYSYPIEKQQQEPEASLQDEYGYASGEDILQILESYMCIQRSVSSIYRTFDPDKRCVRGAVVQNG